MNVLLIGANGQIGKHFITMAKQDSALHPVAMIREEEQQATFRDMGVSTVVANLESDVAELAKVMKGMDAIVFTAGSGPKTGLDKTLLVDLDGAVKTVEAAEQAGVSRFVIVSALQAHHRENWNEAIKPYYVAKHYADRMIQQSKLNYTIIRPGGLTNEVGTGQINAAPDLTRGVIPRQDVAATILTVLTEERTYRTGFDLTSGDRPIAEAIKAL